MLSYPSPTPHVPPYVVLSSKFQAPLTPQLWRVPGAKLRWRVWVHMHWKKNKKINDNLWIFTIMYDLRSELMHSHPRYKEKTGWEISLAIQQVDHRQTKATRQSGKDRRSISLIFVARCLSEIISLSFAIHFSALSISLVFIACITNWYSGVLFNFPLITPELEALKDAPRGQGWHSFG